jgi:cold shock CspA family protein
MQCRFDLMRNKCTPRLSVHGVTLMLRQHQGFEVGVVSMLKKNFGFIKCAERVVDVFFHINALKASSAPLAMDADVRFLPALDAESSKIIATQLEVVAPGTAKFEAVSERRYSGTVKASAGVATGGHAAPPEGVIVALVDGRVETLPYARAAVQNGEQPVLNQQARFLVACRALYAPVVGSWLQRPQVAMLLACDACAVAATCFCHQPMY